MRNFAFVSNMFPSRKDPSYATFVKSSLDGFLNHHAKIPAIIVIRGRKKGIWKLLAYIGYHMKLIFLAFLRDIEFWFVHYGSHHTAFLAVAIVFFRKKVVINFHGDDLALADANPLRKALSVGQWVVVQRSAAIIVPSLYFREILVAKFPTVDLTKVIISPSGGVDTVKFRTRAHRSHWWSGVVSRKEVAFGFIGRIEKDKNWRLLFDAYRNLSIDDDFSVSLCFWGDGSERHILEQLITEHGADDIRYLGALSNSEIPDALSQVDVLVVPSARESLGLSAIEGLSAGRILICSQIRPFTDYTKNNESALHFAVGDCTSLTQRLADVLAADAEFLRRIASTGQDVALSFERVRVADNLLTSLFRVLDIEPF